MDLVITWKRAWAPNTVVENVKSFNEASDLADKAVKEFGPAQSIDIYENRRLIASLRTMR